MQIDKAHLEGEIAELRQQEKTVFQQLSGIQGAIQMCEHLLNVLEIEEPKGNRTPNEKGDKDAVAKGKKERIKSATGGQKGPGG